MTPPIPPRPVKEAEQKARRHWPRMLVAYNPSEYCCEHWKPVKTYLIGHDGGNGAIGSSHGDEDTEVSHPWVLRPAHDWKTNKGNCSKNNDGEAAYAILVAQPCGTVHDDGREEVRRSSETLCLSDAEAQSAAQDDGKSECEGISESSDKPVELLVQKNIDRG